jgi:hypothetical protein
VIEARVLVASQLDDARRDCSVDRVVSRSASIAVNQAGRSFFAVGLPQALQVAVMTMSPSDTPVAALPVRLAELAFEDFPGRSMGK